MQENHSMMVLDCGKAPTYHFGMGVLTTYRKRAGLSQSALAEKAGTSQPQIQRLEKGTRGLSKKWANKIAPIVKTFPEELMFGDRTVPIVGIVSAGEAHFGTESDGNLGLARMPRGGTEETVAVEVRGDSLGGAFDGWLIYYDQRRDPPTDDLLGHLCVVGLQSGQVLVKLLMKGRIPGHYDLFSGSGSGIPLTDQAVVWAARVAGIMPPWLARVEIAAPDEGHKRKKPKRRRR